MTLNIWGGHVKQKLLRFISAHQDVDIFCFQEVYHNATHKISSDDNPVCLDIFSEIQNVLSAHIGFFRPAVAGIYGLGMFVKSGIDVIEEGEITIHHNPLYKGNGPSHSRILQWLEYHFGDDIYSILNVHALWNGMGKTDTNERINQSKRIHEFMSTINTPKILCGDFNLKPDTKSIQILEHDMTNLIKKYNINSTRSSLYPKDEKYADYILTCPRINVCSFQVMNDEVSDHLPLLLDYN